MSIVDGKQQLISEDLKKNVYSIGVSNEIFSFLIFILF